MPLGYYELVVKVGNYNVLHVIRISIGNESVNEMRIVPKKVNKDPSAEDYYDDVHDVLKVVEEVNFDFVD